MEVDARWRVRAAGILRGSAPRAGQTGEQPLEQPEAQTVRVLTYNIHHGEGTDGVFDLPRIASIINGVQPDLVALQEIDERTGRSSGVNQLDELQRLTGMHATFGKAMDYDGGAYGVAVLSRWLPLDASDQPLPSSPDREPRTALTVRLRPADAGPPLQFTCTHFNQGRDDGDRLGQAEFLISRQTDVGTSAILAGDMNATPDSDVMKALGRKWTYAAPPELLQPPASPRPRVRGDYVLYRPENAWRVVESGVIDNRVASDHRPVFAVLQRADPR